MNSYTLRNLWCDLPEAEIDTPESPDQESAVRRSRANPNQTEMYYQGSGTRVGYGVLHPLCEDGVTTYEGSIYKDMGLLAFKMITIKIRTILKSFNSLRK